MRSWSYHLLALFVVLCWGMTLVSSKVLLNFGMQPWALVELRSVLAYGILIFLAPMQLYSGTMRGEITVALLGLTSIPLFSACRRWHWNTESFRQQPVLSPWGRF